jgi:polyisoprenoid-binding protein YceI
MTSATDLLTASSSWVLDQSRSKFSFKNKSMWGLMNVNGHFDDSNGEGRVEADGKATGRLDIKAASVATGVKRRDDHLRSADFFDAEHFPDITVTVESVDPDGDALNVRAQLGIRGNTVALPLRVHAKVLDDGAVELSTTTTVDREQLGVSGNLVGMVSKTATVSADAVFRRAG